MALILPHDRQQLLVALAFAFFAVIFVVLFTLAVLSDQGVFHLSSWWSRQRISACFYFQIDVLFAPIPPPHPPPLVTFLDESLLVKLAENNNGPGTKGLLQEVALVILSNSVQKFVDRSSGGLTGR